MKLTNFALKNPTTVLVLLFLIIITGLKAYSELPREASPDITIPTLIVTTPYFGVAPSDIETLVTVPIEKKLKEITDIKELRSTSAEGASMIIAEFNSGVNIDSALQKVRDKVSLAKPDLPDDAEEPMIMEINFSDFPIMMLSISGDQGLIQLKDMAEDFKDRIENIQGILDVKVYGGLTREIQVEVNPERLQYYGLPIDSVINAIRRENLNIPGGRLKVGTTQFLVRVPGEFESIDEIENIVIKTPDKSPIYIRDVARVIDGFQEKSTISRLNQKKSVSVSIQKRAGENIIAIAQEVKKELETFKKSVPGGTEFTITLDASLDIESMVNDLENNIITGLVLVLGVLLFVMGLKTAVFVAIAIPFSMLISFVVLQWLGVTLNMIVLFSLILALGMLVDNAIVIVENIYRHMQEGEDRFTASVNGVKEVGWPVITSTITTLLAFAPMLFWPGIMGEFMGFLPLTLIVTLTASLFVALVINPVVCSIFLTVKKGSLLQEDLDRKNKFVLAYQSILKAAMRHRYKTISSVFLVLILSGVAYGFLGHGVEFFPDTDPKRINISVKAPDGTSLEESDRIAQIIEERLKPFTDIAYYVTNVGTGGNSGGFGGEPGSTPHYTTINVDFVDRKLRKESSVKTTEKIRLALNDIPGVEIEIAKEENGPPSGPPVNIEISGDKFETLGLISEDIKQKIKEVPNLVDLKDNYSRGKPELRIVIDREKASVMNTSTQLISNGIRTAFNGTEASIFRENDEEYDIIVRFPEEKRQSISDLENVYISGKDDESIPLKDVAAIEISQGLGSVRRLDQTRVVTVSANVEGRNANEVLADVQKIIKEKVELPQGYRVSYTGENEEQAESQKFLSGAFIMAVFLITMVLVTQFNSLVLPAIIMFTVVLSLIGVFWGLIITGTPFGIIMTGIGVISLAGVVVNNGIVFIDYISQLREKGINKTEAVIMAGTARLRPVLLTAVTTVLGLLPMVIGVSFDFKKMVLDVGSESAQWWGPMAVAVAYGLTFSTVLTLIAVPVMYSIFTDWTENMTAFFKRKKVKPETPVTAKTPNRTGDLDEREGALR